MNKFCVMFFGAVFFVVFGAAHANGDFDFDRWDKIQENIRNSALADGVSQSTIDATLKNPVFIPRIVYNDKNQSEFKLTMSDYLNRTTGATRVKTGREMAKKYPTLLNKTYNKYGVPKHVILAFWGMESNYGATKSAYKLKDAFFTLVYDGRREKFFTNQLLALMKIADKNKLDVNNIYGSWAGAMGHFQFIPTTLAAYGADGNNDGKIDIINNISDAMFSAGNYLNKLGWNPNEKIIQPVLIPYDFDSGLLNGNKKYSISDWSKMGVVNSDGLPLPRDATIVGIVGDADADTSNQNFVPSPDNDVVAGRVAYLTYPNFYRIKKWNNSNWYAIAIGVLSEKLK